MPISCKQSRAGFTLIEITLVVIMIGLVSLIGIRQMQAVLDKIATRDAVRAAGDVVARARDEAVALHTLVSVRVDTGTASVELSSRMGVIAHAELGQVHGVRLSTTREVITFDPRGLGYGAANLTLVVRRGKAVDTLVVSRLGRVR